jgi:hypothetical protein
MSLFTGFLILCLLILIFNPCGFKRSKFTSLREDMMGQKIKIWDSEKGWLVETADPISADKAFKIYNSRMTMFYRSKGRGIDDLPALIGALPATKFGDIYAGGPIYLEILNLKDAEKASSTFLATCKSSEKECSEKYLL